MLSIPPQINVFAQFLVSPQQSSQDDPGSTSDFSDPAESISGDWANDSSPFGVSVVDLKAEIQKLQAEKEAQNAVNASLIERILGLEMALSKIKDDNNHSSSTPDQFTKARVIELELARKELESTLGEKNGMIGCLQEQIKQLKAIIQENGVKGDRSRRNSYDNVRWLSNVDLGYNPNIHMDDPSSVSADVLGLRPTDLHLLQTSPWNPLAFSAMKVTEEVYEWQCWNSIDLWTEKPALFPESFVRVWRGAGSQKPNMFTDLNVRKCYSLDDYPLPECFQDDGEPFWEWIGGWMIDSDIVGCDVEGWQYGNSLCDFTTRGCASSTNQYTLRRRKWCRVRALVSVPHASKIVHEFLLVHRKLISLDVMCKKLSNQVLKLQTQFSEKEAEVEDCSKVKREMNTIHRRWQNALIENEKLKHIISELKNEAHIRKAVSNQVNLDASSSSLSSVGDSSNFWGKILNFRPEISPQQAPSQCLTIDEKCSEDEKVSAIQNTRRDQEDEDICVVPLSSFEAASTDFEEVPRLANDVNLGWFNDLLFDLKGKMNPFCNQSEGKLNPCCNQIVNQTYFESVDDEKELSSLGLSP